MSARTNHIVRVDGELVEQNITGLKLIVCVCITMRFETAE